MKAAISAELWWSYSSVVGRDRPMEEDRLERSSMAARESTPAQHSVRLMSVKKEVCCVFVV